MTRIAEILAWCICGVFCEHLCVVCDKDKLFNEAYVLFCLAVLLDIVLLVIIYKLNKEIKNLKSRE